MRRVRVGSLPPEVEDKSLKVALYAFGEFRDIQREIWPNAYRCRVSEGSRMVSMSVVKYIHSYVVVEGYRALISYEGQPTTCYSSNVPGHLQTTSLHRRRSGRKADRQPRHHGRKWGKGAHFKYHDNSG